MDRVSCKQADSNPIAIARGMTFRELKNPRTTNANKTQTKKVANDSV
jgi:hypothetical protein